MSKQSHSHIFIFLVAMEILLGSLLGFTSCFTAPATAPPSPQAPDTTPAPTATPTPALQITAGDHSYWQQRYGSDVINYFFEIALGAEYGSSTPVLRKWAEDLHIQIHGSPNPSDLSALSLITEELNTLLGAVSDIKLHIVDNNANVEIYFVPESLFLSIEPNYVPTNYGFFWKSWDKSDTIVKAKILIDTAKVTQQEREHLIREELTQGLGLSRDSWKYPDSIFYQGWTRTTQYAPIDRSIIKLLYERQLHPGLTRPELEALFGNRN
jgi:hypothetical protein